MARREDDDEYFDEVKQSEEFVLDENLHEFGVYGDEEDEVTYRRAPDMGSTAFVGSRFGALDDDLFHPMMVKTETKNPPTFTSENGFTLDSVEVEAKISPDVDPSGPVPIADAVAYHKVNPMFESEANADEIFRQLKQAVRHQVEYYHCHAEWTIKGFALVAAEEVNFIVQMHRISPTSNVIRIDFNLIEGDDYQFLEIVDKIRKECRDLDREMALLPDFRFDIFSSWSSPGELYPGSMTVDEEDLLLLVEDITSVHSHPFTRYEASKQLKDCCQQSANRDTLRRSHQDQLINALELMMHDPNEDIIRFAIFVILNFAQDKAAWNDMNFPALPQTLQVIEQNVQKRSTKKLAHDLHTAIISQSSCITVGGEQ